MSPSFPFAALDDEVRALERHPVYASVGDLASLRVFLEHHVVCVLDFMSLLERLQAALTCTRTPWVPPSDPRRRA